MHWVTPINHRNELIGVLGFSFALCIGMSLWISRALGQFGISKRQSLNARHYVGFGSGFLGEFFYFWNRWGFAFSFVQVNFFILFYFIFELVVLGVFGG